MFISYNRGKRRTPRIPTYKINNISYVEKIGKYYNIDRKSSTIKYVKMLVEVTHIGVQTMTIKCNNNNLFVKPIIRKYGKTETINIKMLIGKSDRFAFVPHDIMRHRNTGFYNSKPLFKNQQYHTYFIGSGKCLYKYLIRFIPKIFGKKINIDKNDVDKVVINIVNNNKANDIKRCKKILLDKFKNVHSVEITIIYLTIRKDNKRTLFRFQ